MSAPMSARMRRIALEKDLLREISESPLGLRLEQLRDKFPGEMVAHTLDHLEDRRQVYLYQGGVYTLTPSGRSRLSPPVCVAS